MVYFNVNIKWNRNPNAINREFLVREDTTVEELGIAIASSIGASFKHNFMFFGRTTQYVNPLWIKEEFSQSIEQLDYKKILVKDIKLDYNNSINFVYDTGSDWSFKVVFSKNLFELENGENTKILLTDGYGLQIWEDDIQGLKDFLDDKDYIKPYDCFVEKKEDFLKQINIEEINQNIQLDLETYDY